MHPLVQRYLTIRENALASGDYGLAGECSWELRRLGYVEPPLSESAAPETTSVTMPEAAVPPRPRRGRPPKQPVEV